MEQSAQDLQEKFGCFSTEALMILFGVHVDHAVRVVSEFELTGELFPVHFKLFIVPFLRALKIFHLGMLEFPLNVLLSGL